MTVNFWKQLLARFPIGIRQKTLDHSDTYIERPIIRFIRFLLWAWNRREGCYAIIEPFPIIQTATDAASVVAESKTLVLVEGVCWVVLSQLAADAILQATTLV